MYSFKLQRRLLLLTFCAANFAGWSFAQDRQEIAVTRSGEVAAAIECFGSFVSQEIVVLGGIEQTILIRTCDLSQPVLLFLHGGPGGAVMPWVDLFHTPLLEENFVVVHWDQRGAGSSFNDELTIEDITPSKLVADTLQLTNLLRDRFRQEKIFLSGHSWGSALGFMTIAEDSSPYHAFIPTSERVAWVRSMNMGFEWVSDQAKVRGDVETQRKLKAIEPFDSLDEADLTVQREVLAEYGGGDFNTEGLWDRYLSYVLEGQSPYYTDAQVNNYPRGLELSSTAIEQPEIVGAYDLFTSHPVLDLPVHFITGAEDQNTPADLAHEYYEYLKAPAKSFTRIDGAAHMVMYDQPIAWAKALVQIRNQTPTN
ncbi:alpha/beta hydrolase [uncultured Ruegeria sp.]|uniref:alpha/beta fold hydrolase n=1 Tax=uncultured Ruegeria sp. TaxID=259304 RepID=UPI002606749D|nr:alpha/beta hydrolase [uncultured Ruegeria sp.]